MPDAICLGELLIDFVSLDRDAPLAALPRFAGAAGGAPANVAVGLARLGVPAGFIGRVGADPFGDHLQGVLEAEGVDTVHLSRDPEARTTLAFIASRSDGRKDITFYRNPGADIQLKAADLDPGYFAGCRLFHFGGVSLSRSPAREATLWAAAEARRRGLLISYDPNWRPTLWEDHAQARAILWEAMAQADLVHCAEEEWEFITGTAELAEGACRVLAQGPRLVVVTRGERGCYYATGARRGEVPGFVVEVVDPLGAGDAFMAALLTQAMVGPELGALSQQELEQMLTRANAAGALTCTRRGVIPSLPRAEEVEAFLSSRGVGES